MKICIDVTNYVCTQIGKFNKHLCTEALNDDTPIEEYYCFTNHIVVQSSSQRVQPNSQVLTLIHLLISVISSEHWY